MNFPSLAILVPIWKEPIALLKQNRELFANIRYPGRHQVYWILHHEDEETIRAARSLCEPYGLLISSKDKHLKAGNLNYAIAHVEEELIAVFDIDDAFTEGYFVEGVRALLEDPQVRLVTGQGTLSNKDANLVTTCQEMERREWQFVWEHMILKETGGWAPVPGSGFITWKQDLLEIGGFSEETVTEDIDMIVRLLKAGKRIRYFDESYAMEGATNLLVMMRQRARWYKGTLQLFKTHPDLKQTNETLFQTYLWSVCSPLLTVLRLAKYPIVLACDLGVGWKALLMFLLLFTDFEVPHWELAKKHGLLPRRKTYSLFLLDLANLVIPWMAILDYWRRPLYWYLTPKRGISAGGGDGMGPTCGGHLQWRAPAGLVEIGQGDSRAVR